MVWTRARYRFWLLVWHTDGMGPVKNTHPDCPQILFRLGGSAVMGFNFFSNHDETIQIAGRRQAENIGKT